MIYRYDHENKEDNDALWLAIVMDEFLLLQTLLLADYR